VPVEFILRYVADLDIPIKRYFHEAYVPYDMLKDAEEHL
jgi:hypothetical protein